MRDRFINIFFAPLEQKKPVEALKAAIVKNAEAILELNRQQLDRGLDSAGKSLGKYKNFNYKKRWAPVDLLLKGPFRGKMFITVDDNATTIDSKDFKRDILVKRKGEDIFGVPKQLVDSVAAIIEPDFTENFRKQ